MLFRSLVTPMADARHRLAIAESMSTLATPRCNVKSSRQDVQLLPSSRWKHAVISTTAEILHGTCLGPIRQVGHASYLLK